jgi:hypothetical protein
MKTDNQIKIKNQKPMLVLRPSSLILHHFYLVSEVPLEGLLGLGSLVFSELFSLLSAGLSFFPNEAESPLRA